MRPGQLGRGTGGLLRHWPAAVAGFALGWRLMSVFACLGRMQVYPHKETDKLLTHWDAARIKLDKCVAADAKAAKAANKAPSPAADIEDGGTGGADGRVSSRTGSRCRPRFGQRCPGGCKKGGSAARKPQPGQAELEGAVDALEKEIMEARSRALALPLPTAMFALFRSGSPGSGPGLGGCA